MPLLLIPEYSGINKGQRVPDRSKTAHREPLVKCFLTKENVSGGGQRKSKSSGVGRAWKVLRKVRLIQREVGLVGWYFICP